MKKFISKISQLRNNKLFQTVIGSLVFLTIAATVMLLLESTVAESGINSFFQSLWFSIVTVTTVGYGDLSPLSEVGKIAAVIIMIFGVVYVAVVTGNITSWLVERNRRKVLGQVPMKDVEGHFLVCGWKPGMNQLLKDILKLHDRNSNFLVLVNNADPHEVNDLKQDPILRDFHYFSGDYSNTEVLRNACGDHAEKVLILADELSGKSTEEIDFQSVLTAIALKRLKPEIYTIVEIVHPKFQHYLRNVEVEEIILNRYNARALICSIALMAGLNNVFRKFFSLEFGLLKLHEINDIFIGKPYQEIKESADQVIVLGLLENTGNLRQRKYEKMSQIQKTVTIEKAINGLIEIKAMESNVPVFHPAPNYIIKENSSLIVLNTPPGNLNQKHVDETIIEEKWRKRSLPELVVLELKQFLQQSSNWEDFSSLLKRVDLEIYQYQNKISGVIHKNKKYSFEELDLQQDLKTQISKLYKKRQSKKVTILESINTCLEAAEDWYDFFDLLEKQNLSIYLYRNKASGIQFESKKFSFRTLDVDAELINEINRHQDLYLKKPDTQVPGAVHSKGQYIGFSDFMKDYRSRQPHESPAQEKESGILAICGWKPQLPEMIDFILGQHKKHETPWDKIVVIADVKKEQIDEFSIHFKNYPQVTLKIGDIVDPKVLKQAGILQAKNVIILAETETGKSFEEIDAQTVLAAMLIGSMNKHAYKIAEILDRRYEEALDEANVEEIYLEDEFIRVMLANGSHGSGISKVLSELINLENTLFEIREIADKFIYQEFEDLRSDFYSPGKMILGLLEETGNIFARKSEKIHEAQIQSNIKGQVEELIKVKDLLHNNAIIAPQDDYHIQPNSKLILLNTNIEESWKNYLKFGSD
jgi:voltage-gated potassium channel